MLPQEPDRSWGAVVFSQFPSSAAGGEERRYLLVKLASGNHWDHPKGHAEGGESPQETARREIREEGGVEVRFVDGFQKESGWRLPSGRAKVVVYFLAERVVTAPTGGPAGEILDSAWFPYAAARERITYESGKTVLDAAEIYLTT